MSLTRMRGREFHSGSRPAVVDGGVFQGLTGGPTSGKLAEKLHEQEEVRLGFHGLHKRSVGPSGAGSR